MKLISPRSVLSALRARLAPGATGGPSPTAVNPRALDGANDPLTGLPGLTAFEGLLAQAARQADANSTQLALLFVNLDDLHSVNLAAGRPAGDFVLRQAAKRLRSMVKPFMAARLVGDEFLLLMADDPQPRDASALA